jgi:hypothetical protein
MLIFIVPLRSPETCLDWNTVSTLCNDTLDSLTKQNSEEYQILLVCNKPPLNLIDHDRITVVQASFPIPSSRSERFGDIYRKIKRGMVEAKRLQLVKPDSSAFVMRVDADDLVSDRLASFVQGHPDRDGWYFPTGYIHEIGKDHLFLRPRFTTVCGTSHIFNCNYADFPDSMDTPSTEWLETVWQHLNVNKLLQPINRKLNPLPFPGAIYQINSQNGSLIHFDNKRFSSLKAIAWKMLCKRKLTPAVMREFNFSERNQEGFCKTPQSKRSGY